MSGIEFEKVKPEQTGLSEQNIVEFIRRLHDEDIPLHSLLIVKNDKMVCEAYQKPYGRHSLHRMFSITKSMVSLAIGLLEDEGKINLDDYIVDYFPEKLPQNVHPYIAAITVRNMLTMRTAHNKTTYKLEGCIDWVRSFFETEPTHYPGTFFAYDTSSTHVLAALVEKLTGKELLAYLREKVLDDIGFSRDAYCLKDPMGVSMGGSGLMAEPMDIIKVMYLVMKGGKYNGHQYLPEKYLKLATDVWSDNYAISSTFEEMQGYGYQFWHTTHGGYACYGMGGQLGICLPERNMVVVTTADTQGRQGGVQLIYDALWDTVFNDTGRTPADDTGCGLTDVIPQVCLYNRGFAGNADEIGQKEIIVDANEQGFTSFKLKFGDEEGSVIYKNKTGEHTLYFGIGHNIETVFPHYGHRALVSAAWQNENTFLIYAQIIDEYVGKVFINFSFNGSHVGIMLKKIEETYYKEFNLFTGGTIQGD